MPELPEVETYRKYLEEALYDEKIIAIELEREKILKTDYQVFKKRLVGQKFISTKRVGKYLFLELADHSWVLFHFGMTGKVAFYVDEELRPKYSRLVIEFKGGLKLAFINMRLFGKVLLIKDLDAYLEDNQLGVDALDIPKSDFIDYVKGRKSPIKSVLLHQKAFAGVGNWIADEVLFQARIYPNTNCKKLSDQELELIHEKMMEVLQVSVDKQADYHQFPDHFMVQHRWGDGNCPLCGKKMNKMKIGGRGTYYCEREQKQI